MNIITTPQEYEAALEELLLYLNSVMDESLATYLGNTLDTNFIGKLLISVSLESKLLRDIRDIVDCDTGTSLYDVAEKRNDYIDRHNRHTEKIAELYNKKSFYPSTETLDTLLQQVVFAEPHYIDAILN